MMTLSFIYSDDYGRRVIRNLVNDPSLCHPCGILCDLCKYGLYSHTASIRAAFELPDTHSLPPVIDEPTKYLPRRMPSTDLCVITGMHQDLLLEMPVFLNKAGTKALVVPIEDFVEVPSGLKKQIERKCMDLGLECAFPKPFCTLEPSSDSPIISEFIESFGVGSPLLSIDTETRRGSTYIKSATVRRSAPCGSTWYVAKKLLGEEVELQRIRDIVARAHHAYPCTATMAVDPELKEPILHRAGYAVREEVERHLFPKD